MNIQGIKPFMFVDFAKQFYFSDKQSSDRFKSAFTSFVERNKSDSHQKYGY